LAHRLNVESPPALGITTSVAAEPAGCEVDGALLGGQRSFADPPEVELGVVDLTRAQQAEGDVVEEQEFIRVGNQSFLGDLGAGDEIATLARFVGA
jgi:hypothetical protein